MDIKASVQSAMKYSIDKAPVDPELKKAAIRHHQFKGFQKRLYDEIVKVDIYTRKTKNKALSRDQISFLVQSLVITYLTSIQQEADKRAMSDLEKSRLESQAQHKKDLEQTVTTGQMSGEFEEFKNEVKIVDREEANG